MRRVRLPRPRHALALFALVAIALAGCSTSTDQALTSDPDPPSLVPGRVVTEQGELSAGLYGPVMIIAALIFLVVEGLLIVIALRYRRRKTDTELPRQTHGNNLLEIAWTLIPAVIVTGLFVASTVVVLRVEANTEQPGEIVDVTGFQWQWTFAYPEHATATGEPLAFTGAGTQGPEMVVPVGEPVRIRLTAQDVIHAFYVPQTFYKKDAIPGRINEFDLTFTEEGTFAGQCAEFCGLAHADMYFTVRVVPRAEYDQWVQAAIDQANATPTPAPSGQASPPASGAPGGVVIENATTPDAPVSFTTDRMQAPAGAPVHAEYLNDSAILHNIAFYQGPDASAPLIAQTEPQTGPGNLQAVDFTAPTEPGSYFFNCVIHPQQMVGTFEVTP